MRRILLSPKWWLGHVLVLIAVLVMLRLGLWQWHRSQSGSGGIQNYAYAFQWPCFAVFAIVLWVKTIRLELHKEEGVEPTSRFGAKPFDEPKIKHVAGVRVGITTTPHPVDDDDREVAEYNARLARLNARAEATAATRAGR
ncbi:MAG TPA: transcriptional regulator [Mycobacteriales bacterium]|nr:transcriptional regulator [Mycobacteriales bacterium]